MMKYNEWKLLNESLFSLGLKSQPTVGGPIGGTGIYEGGFDFNKKDDEDDSDEDDYDDDDDSDDDEDPVGDDELKDNQLDGDVFGASKEEGGPAKSFPPEDSEDMDDDDMDFDDDQFDLAFGADKGMDHASMGGDDLDGEDLGDDDAGLGHDHDMGGMDDLGGDDLGLGGNDDMGMDDLGGDDMGDDLGGEPCPDCNPDGHGEGDPECHTCHGHGFLDDGDDGKIDGDDMGHDIDKMNFMKLMTNYQKKYMGANPGQLPAPPSIAQQNAQDITGQAPQMGGQPQAQQPQMARQQAAQLQQQQRMQGQQFQKKFMSAKPQQPVLQTRKPDIGEDMRKKSYCGKCENVGTYNESHDDFLSNLASNAKGEVRKKFSSGIAEDALLQAVDPNYQFDAGPEAGGVGFAPQGRVGSIGGGYTQDDVKQIPVLGESKKFPTLDQYLAKRKNR